MVCCVHLQLHLGKAKSMPVVIYNCKLSFNKSNMEPLFHLFSDLDNDQVQMASTESFFITLGHGSPPKISGDTVTVQEL